MCNDAEDTFLALLIGAEALRRKIKLIGSKRSVAPHLSENDEDSIV